MDGAIDTGELHKQSARAIAVTKQCRNHETSALDVRVADGAKFAVVENCVARAYHVDMNINRVVVGHGVYLVVRLLVAEEQEADQIAARRASDIQRLRMPL